MLFKKLSCVNGEQINHKLGFLKINKWKKNNGFMCILSFNQKRGKIYGQLVINSESDPLLWRAVDRIPTANQGKPHPLRLPCCLPMQQWCNVCKLSCASYAWRRRASDGSNLFHHATLKVEQTFVARVVFVSHQSRIGTSTRCSVTVFNFWFRNWKLETKPNQTES